MPETLQQLKVRTAREIKQRTAASIARLRGEEEISDEDSDKTRGREGRREKGFLKAKFYIHNHPIFGKIIFF